MKYRNILALLSIVIILFPIIGNAQVDLNIEVNYVNGFSNYIHGGTIDYHSCHPEANNGLLIRCLNQNDYIEWQTDSVHALGENDSVKFLWIGGYAVGSAKARHTFTLDAGNNIHFTISLEKLNDQKSWSIKQDGNTLAFEEKKIDNAGDYFGYFSLTVPARNMNGNKNLKIKVMGDGAGSRDWYMIMQYPLVQKIRITPERIISKDEDGRLGQQVKVSIDNFSGPKSVKISTEGNEAVNSVLGLGANDYILKYQVTNSPAEKSIEINIAGQVSTHKVTIKPIKKLTFYLIPEAHVDIGYTSMQHECEMRHWKNYDIAIQNSIRTQNYPAEDVFKWNVESLWAVKSYLQEFPEKRAQFIDAVKKGWMNLDANFANILTGLCRPEELYKMVSYSNILEKETGVKIESAMISDVPGYTWGIVQAYADNGIKYFSVGPNPFDRIGNTLKQWGDKPFYWKSPSGDKKILVWVAGKGYAWFHGWQLTRDDMTPLLNYMDDLEAENYPYDMVHLRYNIGGDNGYPDSLLSDFVKNWNATHETPKFVISSTMQMFKDFEAKYGSKIPEYSGDFTPYWEDGAASSAKETALNRNTAELLTQLENLYTIKGIKDYPQNEFDDAWQNVVLYSEHTWGAWNSISDPENQLVKDQWAVKQSFALKADSIAKKLYAGLAFDNNSNEKMLKKVFVYNTSSWPRTDVVSIPSYVKTAGDIVTDKNGKQIKSQRLTTGDLVFIAEDVPPLGYNQYSIVEGKNKNSSANIKDDAVSDISNKYYDISLNSETGAVEKLIEKAGHYNIAGAGNEYGFNGFVFTGRNAVNPQTNGRPQISIKENGPVVKSVVIKSAAPECNSLTREIELYSDLKKIDIINTIDKKNNYNKENLRFSFPFNVPNPETKLDIAWAVISPEKDQLPGANKNYFTVQRWADVSNKNIGVTLATIDAPLLEVGGMYAEAWIKPEGQEWFTKDSSSSLLYSWVMNNSWHTNYKASQEGVASFRYALLPHNKFDYLKTYKFGVEQSQPLMVLYTDKNVKNTNSLFRLDKNTQIVLSSMEPTRDKKAILIRLFNPTKTRSETALSWQQKPSKIYLSNADEDNISPIKGKITLMPFEVKTIKVEF